jgi:hypothetical protein
VPFCTFLRRQPGHRLNPVKAAHILWARIGASASDLLEASWWTWKGSIWPPHTAFVRKGHQVACFDVLDGPKYQEHKVVVPPVWYVFGYHTVLIAAMGMEVHTSPEREIPRETCCIHIKGNASTKAQVRTMVTMWIKTRSIRSTNVVAEIRIIWDIYFCS